jgi:hypothetical protein
MYFDQTFDPFPKIPVELHPPLLLLPRSGLVQKICFATLQRDGSSEGVTSVTGQSRRSDRAPITSGLPRKADKFGARWHFAFVPCSN